MPSRPHRSGSAERVAPAEATTISEVGVGAAERAFRFHYRDMVLGQLVHEARGGGRLVKAAVPAVLGKGDLGPPARARKADIGEPSLLLQTRQPALVQRALMGEKAFLPAGQKHGVELQPFGRVQGHERDAVAVIGLIRIHDQGDMLQEALQALELVHEAHEFLQVLQPRLRLRALVGCHMAV